MLSKSIYLGSTDDINNAINEIAEYEEKKVFIKDLRWLKNQ